VARCPRRAWTSPTRNRGLRRPTKKDKAPPVAAAAAARAPGGKAGKGKKGKGKKGDAAAKKGKGKDGPKKAARKDPVAKGGKKSPRKKGPGEAKEKKKAGAGMARKGQKADRNQAHNKVLPGQDKVQSGASKPGKKSAPSPPSALGAMRAMFESDKPEFVANHSSAGQLAALAAAVVFVAAVATVIVFPQRLEQLKALRHLNQNAPMLHETTQFLGDRRSMTGADAMTEG